MRVWGVAALPALVGVGFLTTGIGVPTAFAETENPGCPAGWQLRTVESLAATGNAPVPGQVDAAGNGDGSVCALPLPDAICFANGYDPCPVETVYMYRDNDLPGR